MKNKARSFFNRTHISFSTHGVCWPKGFRSAGMAAGIKKENALDLGLVVSDFPASAAGVFTRNQFMAHPVAYSRDVLKKYKRARAILANSGNANAGCGKYGKAVVLSSVQTAAKLLGLRSQEVLVFSTGRIGQKFPAEKLIRNLPVLISSLKIKDALFSTSILTTDTMMKTASAEFQVDGKLVRLGASAKGAGMIEPSMATMLCFITCDAKISHALMQKALNEAVNQSFNRITVDGDMSTNDSVVLLCNGASGVRIINDQEKGYDFFRQSLIHICRSLSEKMVEDGEGATKLIRINVSEAASEKDAEEVCRSIGNSMLLKCAFFGNSPNWGRILSSIGATRAKFNPLKVKIVLQGKICFQNGEPDFEAAEKLKNRMRKKEITIDVTLGAGTKSSFLVASDLTYDYVKINAH
ncbi:MAG: bifunctional glutamate N-acetyltransferase/amino-acid acetyltransferase ArgJ [Candidatus Aureabacteria bacterium]|nr:bifunctional glutamate N-acetyltransferase/amino-acid acetyltransferase ArgJ [Candidatus Auribacterota bacterium]